MLPPRVRRLFRLAVHRRALLREETDDEIRFHLDARIEQLVRRGMPAAEARLEAERRFGSLDAARRDLQHSAEHRENRMRWHERFDALTSDLRHAFRALRRRPGFVAGVVLTLALGIGANATMFSIVDRLLLRPPAHLADPGTAGRVYLFTTYDGEESSTRNIPFRRYLDLKERTRAFSHMATFFAQEMVIGLGDAARSERVTMASAEIWPLFGVRPALGRFFSASEDQLPMGTRVAVLGYGYWQSRYGADRAVLGQQIRIDQSDYTIIGVAPEGFTGVSPQSVVAFVPITAASHDQHGDRMIGTGRWFETYNMSWVEVMARRRPGVTPEAADAELTAAYRWSLEKSYALRPRGGATVDERRPRGVLASTLSERGPMAGPESKVATWLAGVAVLVLCMACANVANLMLARSAQRRRELAVRVALGVSRGRLLVQQLSESVLLALLGGVAGLLVAIWGGGALRALLLPDVDWTQGRVDSRLLLFTAIVAVLAGLLTGLAPVLHARRERIADALKAGGREGSLHGSRMRIMLLAVQAAVSVLLLVGAGLFVRSLRNVTALDLGYDPERVAVVMPDMRGVKLDSAEHAALRERLLAHVQAMPTVEAAGYTVMIPFWRTWSEDISVPGRDSAQLRGEWLMNAVSPDYFRTMGTELVRGRGIAASDLAGRERVAVVSRSAAEAIWPGADAIGQCIKLGADTMPCHTVVGVAVDIRRDFREGPGRHIYLSSAQRSMRDPALLLRMRGDAKARTDQLRRELQRLMPGDAFVRVTPMEEVVAPELRPWRLGATMFTLFGALALLVAAVGLYSVVSYGVAQRTHELGVRIALGARARDVVRLVLGEGVRTTVLGVVVGLAGALFAGKWVAGLLFEVSPRDPFTIGGVMLALLLLAVGASIAPALRAAKTDPNVALRSD
jgi:predicted permease